MSEPCVFCNIIASKAPGKFVARWWWAVAIEPRHPVTDGHVMVIPRRHVKNAIVSPLTTAVAFWYAARLGRKLGGQHNLITSIGEDATQTQFHLHIHRVPRRPGDGLKLPWTGQKRGDR